MKKILFLIFVLSFNLRAQASPNSVIGATPLQTDTAHAVSVGWPSLAYEWWHSGKQDWALGAELVYGDWSGNFSDVDIGLAINVPFRWHLRERGRVNVAFKLAPGGLMGTINSPGDDLFVGGIRMEAGLPISIDIDSQFRFITGVSVPFTVMFVENSDPFVVIPIMPRLGVEVAVAENVTPFLLVELGPTIAVGDFGSEVEFGVRASVGALFW